ncbi:hypothetical protein GCM10009551_088830 [Nocardiopsis tropica]
MNLTTAVAEAMDAALAHGDELGLYDDLSKFPAARAVVAEELVDQLLGYGFKIITAEHHDRLLALALELAVRIAADDAGTVDE